jgi:hypothetical protein
LLALTCTLYNIRLVVHHVKGIENHLSDWISRVLGAEFADPQGIFNTIGSKAGESDFILNLHYCVNCPVLGEDLSRREVCRALLSNAIVRPNNPTASEIIQMIGVLRGLDLDPPLADTRIPQVLSSFQRVRDINRHPDKIPGTLDKAMSAAATWDTF